MQASRHETHEHHSFPTFQERFMSISDEQQIRDIFAAWFEATSRKDATAATRDIAQDVVSYEHDAPLAYHGVEAVREVCQRGFDASEGSIDWSVPGMAIVVQGDLAVQWGLNKMSADGGEMWSRGTRVFRKKDGRWEMVHQHVSFPYDPQTGQASLDCTPSDGDQGT